PNPPQGGNIRLVIFFITMLLFTSLAHADEAATLFQQGNQAYQAGDYEQAAAAFAQIIALKKENWQVYYNLGNAYFKQRKTGLAILNYERASRLQRASEDLQFNLDLANLSITDRILAPPRSAMLVWFEGALIFFSHEQAAGYALFFWWGALLGLIFLLTGRKESLRSVGRILTWSSGALCLLFASIFLLQWYEQKTEQYGIVMEQRVVARSSPGADATEVFIIHEGAKVKLQEQTGAWQRIRLADGKVGWLKAESVAKI
ncbi:MAG: tetratricopeptide repeat protein, partial [candidate division KSB1 bacterium]